MSYEEETEYSTICYRCIDPVENFKIKVVLEPVKNLYIPLPQFDIEQYPPDIYFSHEDYELEAEEYTFKWQEKIFSRSEIKKYSSQAEWKKKLSEQYNDSVINNLNNLKNYPSKIFSYVETDNYLKSENEVDIFSKKTNFVSSLNKRMNDLLLKGQSFKNYKNVPKRKIINYYPSEEFKNQAHLINKNVQRMFIMVDLGSKVVKTNESECEEHFEAVLCSITYDHSNSVLQITPSFSQSEFKPYSIGMQNENGKNCYYYWIYHASPIIKSGNLTKEIQLMSKLFDYQEEVTNLKVDPEFFVGKPDHVYITLLGEILSARDFEYDHLHIHYFAKLPSGWGYSDIDSLMGRTQTARTNSKGICYFSYLFEMNFCVELNLFEDPLAAPLEIFFEVLSVDKYKRYRSEGYSYISLPKSSGMHKYKLKCWRILDRTITSQLKRFFIGGGPELEDVSYVGLSPSDKAEVMSRFGVETIPSGAIKLNLNIFHQSKNFVEKKGEPTELEKNVFERLDAGSLLGSVNVVLEAFRRARERMLQAKKGLQTNLNSVYSETQENDKKCD